LRFAVHWPGNPVASPRSHGVPRRDVPGRVHVSVAGVTAGGAQEDGLALARPPVHLSARRATLACERRVDLLNPAGGLLLQPTDQQAPPGPQDASVKPSLGADALTRVLPCAFRGSGQPSNSQVFDPDYIKAPRDIRASFLGPVLASVRLAGLQLSDGESHSLAVLRTASGAGEFALKPPHPVPFPRGQTGYLQQLTGRQGCRYCHAPVNTYARAVAGCRDRLGNRCECDMPAPSPVHCHPIGLYPWTYHTGPSEPHPPDLRHPHLADLTRQTSYVPLLATPHDPKSFVTAGLAPRWSPSRITRVEERNHCMRKIPQRLLLHYLGACGQPRMIGAGGGELPTLLGETWSSCPARKPVRMLLDGQIPDISGMGAVFPQHLFLGVRGEQPVAGHANILATTTDISGEVKRRSFLGLKARMSAPQSQ